MAERSDTSKTYFVLQYNMLEESLSRTVILSRMHGMMTRYIIVRRNDSIAKFHEAFINYGFNKISYVETLRRYGYRFVIGGEFFAFDLPHLP